MTSNKTPSAVHTARRAWTRQEIIDLLSDAISESLGPDWNSTDGAHYCFDALTQADIIGPATLTLGEQKGDVM